MGNREIVFREDVWLALDEDHCATLLCLFFKKQHEAILAKVLNDISFAKYQKRELKYEEKTFLQYYSQDDLKFHIMDFYGVSKISKTRIKLVEVGILIEKENPSKFGNCDNSKCYIFNPVKFAELLGQPIPPTTEKFINGVLVKNNQVRVLVKNNQPITEKMVGNAQNEVKNEENVNSNVESPLVENNQYKDISILDKNSNSSSSKKGSVKNNQLPNRKKATTATVPVQINFTPNAYNEQSRPYNEQSRPYSEMIESDRVKLVEDWYSVDLNKEHVQRALINRDFCTYEITDAQMREVIVSYATTGLGNYDTYKHINTEGGILRTFPQWAARAKELYPIHSVKEIKKFLFEEPTKPEMTEKIEKTFGGREGGIDAVIKIQNTIKVFVERRWDGTKDKSKQIKMSSADFPVPTLADIRGILWLCNSVNELDNFGIRLSDYKPEARPLLPNKSKFQPICEFIFKQIQK